MAAMVDLMPAYPCDAAEIATTIGAAFAQYAGVLVPESGALSETVETVAAKLAAGWGAVAWSGATMAGCVLYERRGDALYLGRLAVRPEWRGRGLARRLVAHVEAEAAVMGLARITLNVRLALPGNREFFAARSFREVERRSHPGFTEPTYVVMEKPAGWP